MLRPRRKLVAATTALVHIAPWERRSLVLPLGVEERFPERLARQATLVMALAILLGVLWCACVQVSEVSRAVGVLTPIALEQQVDQPEGGTVAALLVREGQVVERGQPLLRLNDGVTPQDLAVARGRRDGIVAQIAAVEALRAGHAPRFDSAALSSEAAASTASAVARLQTSAAERGQLAQQAAQAAANAAAVQAELATATSDLGLTTTERDRYRTLLDKGLTTATAFTQRERILVESRGRVAQLRHQLSAAQSRLGEANRAMAAYTARGSLELSEQLRVLRAQLAEIDGDVAKKSGRSDRLVVRSPVRGIVKKLAVNGIGEVLAPGAPVATIVPTGSPLYVDAQVAASEIGYLRTGMTAKIKVSAFDFTRFGWIEGAVRAISPSSFTDPQGRRFYRVEIALNDVAFKHGTGKLLPGMDVEADIITGHKTMLNYLLSPVRRGFDSAFSEH